MPLPDPAETVESLYDYTEAARRLHVKKSWLEAKVQQRAIPHHRFGRLVRFTEDDLAEIVASTRQPVVARRRR